jgi:hypothetical protein
VEKQNSPETHKSTEETYSAHTVNHGGSTYKCRIPGKCVNIDPKQASNDIGIGCYADLNTQG